MFWLKVKAAASKAWEAIAKLPGWAITAFLLVFAVCWYLVDLLARGRQVNEIRRDQITLEKEHHETLKQITDEDQEQRELVEKEYLERTRELDEVREHLLERTSEGPVGIANAWKDYLTGGKE